MNDSKSGRKFGELAFERRNRQVNRHNMDIIQFFVSKFYIEWENLVDSPSKHFSTTPSRGQLISYIGLSNCKQVARSSQLRSSLQGHALTEQIIFHWLLFGAAGLYCIKLCHLSSVRLSLYIKQLQNFQDICSLFVSLKCNTLFYMNSCIKEFQQPYITVRTLFEHILCKLFVALERSPHEGWFQPHSQNFVRVQSTNMGSLKFFKIKNSLSVVFQIYK